MVLWRGVDLGWFRMWRGARAGSPIGGGEDSTSSAEELALLFRSDSAELHLISMSPSKFRQWVSEDDRVLLDLVIAHPQVQLS